MSNKLLVKNAKQVVLICNNGEKFLTKDGMQKLCVIENSSLVIGSDGLIKDIGPASTIDFQYAGVLFDKVIDATGMCVIPGLVDAHTHPVWAGDRVHEFAMKLAGATYMDVHHAGGGIHFTVEHTRAALPSTLLASLTGRLGRMQRAGTTLVECKSGYGLELQTELKMLEVIETARRTLPINISSTYCGAHAVPKRTGVMRKLGGKREGVGSSMIMEKKPVVMHLACVNMRMSMPEALAAATINAAYALGRSHTHGSLEVNKHGDLLVLNAPRWEHLIYQLGGHQELIRYVVIRGNVVYNNDKTMDF
ncbi:probable imidazolonepropionase [Salvelinus sp. IW2-2015]|uniref:probable imidazolonepropionase n=1 Tax=Salvelinus sp. IW2-2015 TaxID=2691554 RepID=UPI0038D40F3F